MEQQEQPPEQQEFTPNIYPIIFWALTYGVIAGLLLVALRLLSNYLTYIWVPVFLAGVIWGGYRKYQYQKMEWHQHQGTTPESKSAFREFQDAARDIAQASQTMMVQHAQEDEILRQQALAEEEALIQQSAQEEDAQFTQEDIQPQEGMQSENLMQEGVQFTQNTADAAQPLTVQDEDAAEGVQFEEPAQQPTQDPAQYAPLDAQTEDTAGVEFHEGKPENFSDEPPLPPNVPRR